LPTTGATPTPIDVLTTAAGVQTSADGAATWSAFNSGLPGTFPGLSIGFNAQAPTNLIVSGAQSIGSPHVFTANTGNPSPTWAGFDCRIPIGTGRDFDLNSIRFQAMVGNLGTGNDNGSGGTGGAVVITHQGVNPCVAHAVAASTGTGRVIAGSSATLLFVAVNGTKPDGSAGTGGIFKSIDKAVTWTESDTGIDATSRDQIWTMAIDPSNALTMYAGVLGPGRVFKSIDGGVTWAQTTTEPGDTTLQVLSFAIHPTSGAIYAGTSSGVYKSIDGGATWTLSGLPGVAVRALAIDPAVPTTIYGGIDRDPGLVVSTTGG
ncbi:MAG TPA: hypothetical protein VFF06_20910, partial [Polyangia bacterium]|nr:hypothetical protein [Polyangia bacterium]